MRFALEILSSVIEPFILKQFDNNIFIVLFTVPQNGGHSDVSRDVLVKQNAYYIRIHTISLVYFYYGGKAQEPVFITDMFTILSRKTCLPSTWSFSHIKLN